MAIRIVLAEDHSVVRQGLLKMLETESDFTVVGEAGNGNEAVALVKALKPDIVIMDVGMPELSGIEAARQVRDHDPQTKILALSMHSEKQFVTQMLEAGAAGYILKDCIYEELVSAIRSLMDEKAYLSPKIAHLIVEDIIRPVSQAGDPASILSERERDVLRLLAEGRTSRQIADTLHISAKTVEKHRAQLMYKLDLHTVADLTKYAIRNGLTSL